MLKTKWDQLMQDCSNTNSDIEKVLFTSDSLDILYFPTSLEYYFQLIDREFVSNLNSARCERMKKIMVYKQFKKEAIEKLPENFFEMIQSEEIAFAFYHNKHIYFVHKEAAKQLVEKYKIKTICSSPYTKTDLIMLYQIMHCNNINLCCSIRGEGAIKIISAIDEVAPNSMKNVGLLITNFKKLLPNHEFISYVKDTETRTITIYIEFPEYSRRAFVFGLEYIFTLDGEELSLTMITSNKNISYEDRYFVRLYDFKRLEKFSMQKFYDIYNSIDTFDKEHLLSLNRQKVIKVLDLEDIYGKQKIKDFLIPEFTTKYDFIKFITKIPTSFIDINLSIAKKNKLDKRISSIFKNPYLVF